MFRGSTVATNKHVLDYDRNSSRMKNQKENRFFRPFFFFYLLLFFLTRRHDN
jgi:hypothetical protein